MLEIVGSKSCNPCKMVRAMLDSKGVEYTYYSIEEGSLPEHISDIKSVPAIFKDKEFIGYGVDSLKKVI